MELIFSKICTLCKVKKLIEHFGKNKTQPYGRHYYCKECVKQQSEKHKEKNKEWYERNKEKVSQYQKEYREKNRDKINEYHRTLPLEKKQKVNCSEKKKQKAKERNQDEAHKKKRNKYYREKYIEDIQYKTKKILEARLRALVKKNDSVKAIDFLGCTVSEFKAHIEKKFVATMSWDSYGPTGWTFDYIVPACKFDLTDPEQVKLCFHYSNIQPLFAVTKVINGVTFEGNLNKNRY